MDVVDKGWLPEPEPVEGIWLLRRNAWMGLYGASSSIFWVRKKGVALVAVEVKELYVL